MTATVLVVDDIESNIKLLNAKLFNEYYNVLTATSGKQALEILADRGVDIVLLDVMMPEMDGFTVCKKIKADPSLFHIPVVMVTALSDRENKLRGLECGADEFLTKPIRDVELLMRVKSLVRMKETVDALNIQSAIGAHEAIVKKVESDLHGKIFVVNDDAALAKRLDNTLKPLSTEIMFGQGGDYLKQIEEFVPDVLIINHSTEDVDSTRLCANVKSVKSIRNVSIMAVLEEYDQPTLVKMFEIGINDYCVQPIDESELLLRVKSLLKRKRYHEVLKSYIEESLDLSFKDGLTQVHNRRYFDTNISDIMERCAKLKKRSLWVAMIDIDHFKKINDTYGHPSGDEVLRVVARAIREGVRLSDVVVRYGGEEFVLLINNADVQTMNIILDRICNKIRAIKVQTSGGDIGCTVSVGVAKLEKGESQNDLIAKADKMLYKAKESGRDRIVFFE